MTLSIGQGDTRTIAIHDASQVNIGSVCPYVISVAAHKCNPGLYIQIKPQERLLSNSRYYLLFDTGTLNDAQGNDLAGLYEKTTYSFTTSQDNTPPYAISRNLNPLPESGEWQITFNEPIRFPSLLRYPVIDQRYLTLIDDSSKETIISASMANNSPDNNQLLLRHVPLDANSHYRIRIPAHFIADVAGNSIPSVDTTIDINSAPDTRRPQLLVMSDIISTEAIWMVFDEAVKAGKGFISFDNGQDRPGKISINDSQQIQFYANQLLILPKPSLALGNYKFILT